MKNLFKVRDLTIASCCLLAAACSKRDAPNYHPPAGISWLSALHETTELNSATKPIESWEQSQHFSSSESPAKIMLSHLAPKITGDMDHGFFYDVLEHENGVDATLAEVYGTGMISWIWSANPTGTIRLFIDDETTPVLEMNFKQFMKGQFLPIEYPFSAHTAQGHNLHFPFLHKKYCKLVVHVSDKKELGALYYQVAWNAVDPSQPLHPFSKPDLFKGTTPLKKIAATLNNPQPRETTTLQTIRIPANQATDIYSSDNPGTITDLLLKSTNKESLSKLHLIAYWEKSTQASMDTPLYLLAGSSEHLENVQSVPATIKKGLIHLRWPMPYQSVTLKIENHSNELIELQYSLKTTNQTSPMRLHTRHSLHDGLWTDQKNRITLADISGTGRMVGCNIQVKSQTDKWWGEGDQHIYLGPTLTPTWQSTGTEDYFGYAWCSKETFDHPFRGQSAVREDHIGRTTALHRYHLLDKLPFHHGASFQTEAVGSSFGFMSYEALVLYYLDKR